MSSSFLLKNFDLTTQTHEGISSFRRAILKLAIQGKLSSRVNGDGTAFELVDKAKSEKVKVLKEVNNDEVPFNVPNHWLWTRFGKVQNFINGFSFKSKDYVMGGVGVVRIGDIQNGVIDDTGMKCVEKYFLDNLDSSYRVMPGDLLIAMSGATTGKIGFNRTEKVYLLNQRVGKIKPIGMNDRYIYYYLLTKVEENLGISSGSAIPNLSTEQINNLLIPIPPLEEQKRIVSKVDQLMTLCDELEVKQEKQTHACRQLNDAALNALLSATSSEEFEKHWQRIVDNFDLLYDDLETLDSLRRAIFKMAVEGRLSSWWRRDNFDLISGKNHALKLLEKIKLEIKTNKFLPDIDEKNTSIELPDGWVFCRLGELMNISSGDGLTSAQMAPNGIYPVFGGNGINGYHDKYNIQKKTIVIGRVGALCGTVHVTPEKAWITDNAFIVTFSENNCYLDWFSKLLSATDLRERARETAQPVISGKRVYPIRVMLPPLAEQKVISEVIDQLMALCDELEKKLTAKSAHLEKLTESLLRV